MALKLLGSVNTEKEIENRKYIDNIALGNFSKIQFECLLCPYSSEHYIEIRKHIAIHNQLICSSCGKSFSNKETLKTHMIYHTGNQSFECDLCPLKFSHWYSHYIHRVNKISQRAKTKSFDCQLCSYKSPYRWYLKRHLLTHTGERPHACHMCNQRFALKENLKKHYLVHFKIM
ncbi:gastrula zinc finger protein XlCGF49.1 [Parasteatoda tepidariorum]|uniref:gastrula zinc finger protein XlCGF49.1 n=1 Tax=Parasteatoda tepidariorum TaxID=114398 RepID=UPI001C7196DE|nr:transcriptional repressor CTCF-like [Parasteatoda tepidariorum]XP_042912128.1 transcriptional repressor CTCF-like [Parasteatoda tepidariorum]